MKCITSIKYIEKKTNFKIEYSLSHCIGDIIIVSYNARPK